MDSSAQKPSLSKSNVREALSNSFDEECDEEALKQPSREEIDVRNLGLSERRKLLERLVHGAGEGNEKFLKKMKQRFDRVGMDVPTIEVRFEHLSVEAEAHVGGRALPTVVNFTISMIEAAIEIPYIFAQSLTYGFIVYTMIGFEWTFAKFTWYLVVTFFTFSYFTYYGMMAVGITPNLLIASIVSSAFYGLWNLFAGYVLPRTRVPAWWKWYSYMNPISWSLYGLLASQFGDVNEEIEGGMTVAEFVRDFFGFEHDFVVYCVLITGGFALLFAAIFALSIKAFNFQKR